VGVSFTRTLNVGTNGALEKQMQIVLIVEDEQFTSPFQ
jgi:hypothetical protein